MVSKPDDEVLAEQLAYYRARADEYDDNFLRRGRYDQGTEATAKWFRELKLLNEALDELSIDGADVLELASGTGIWTERLVGRARWVTAVDAAPEMIDRCRERLRPIAERIEFVQADLFTWRPRRRYDGVVCCFWLSHVPKRRIDGFLSRIAAALRPGGWFFFADNLPEPTSSAVDHLPPIPDEEVTLRRVANGTGFRVVKHYWSSEDLAQRCANAGLEIELSMTPSYFQYGTGRRRALPDA